jgi:hypothetical protein
LRRAAVVAASCAVGARFAVAVDRDVELLF